MTKKKNKKYSSFLLCLIIIIALAFFGLYYYNKQLEPVTQDSEMVIFVVKDNASLNSILAEFESEDIINSEFFAKIYTHNKIYSIKAGTYQIDKSNSLDEILMTISTSSNAIIDTTRITFIEGDWLKDIVKKISADTILTEEEINIYLSDKEVLNGLIENYDVLTDEILATDIRYPLEGYLFPNTYDFYRDTTVQAAIEKMLNETEKVYQDNKQAFDSSDLSIHELMSLASIVQYEASSASDMKLIAGVFYNRLEKPMPLQSSVTVCYALDVDENDDWKDCETNPDFESKYNTYKYPGLTPGPILNPGLEAIKAVLYPTDSDYYFFMADVYGDGTVYYAKTYQEHLEYVNKYLK
jgi:UPF0755 protein